MTTLTLCGACAAMHAASAGTVNVTVRDVASRALADVVVTLKAVADTPKPRTTARPTATMDQRDLNFVPEVLVVQTGTSVDFPNSDQVKHQVYSFSSARSFQLPLYVGHVHPPLLFDKPGVVTLGCNIHDSMLGFIYVTDTPWFGKTSALGSFTSAELPAGAYDVTIWHPRFNEPELRLTTRIDVPASGEITHTFALTRTPSPPPNQNAGKKWRGY